ECLVCTAWLGSPSFTRVVRSFAAPQIRLVAYPFEVRWLYRYGQKERNSHPAPSMTPIEKSHLLGLSDDSAWPADAVHSSRPDAASHIYGDSRIDLEERLTRKGLLPFGAIEEESIAATLVSFSG